MGNSKKKTIFFSIESDYWYFETIYRVHVWKYIQELYELIRIILLDSLCTYNRITTGVRLVERIYELSRNMFRWREQTQQAEQRVESAAGMATETSMCFCLCFIRPAGERGRYLFLYYIYYLTCVYYINLIRYYARYIYTICILCGIVSTIYIYCDIILSRYAALDFIWHYIYYLYLILHYIGYRLYVALYNFNLYYHSKHNTCLSFYRKTRNEL